MKRLLPSLLALALVSATVLGWQYTVQNTWNGSEWRDGSTRFTPPGTAVDLRMDAPDKTLDECCMQDPQTCCTKYDAVAKLSQGTSVMVASKRNGGCVKTSGTVNTSQEATLTAHLEWICTQYYPGCGEDQSWGPVHATAGSLLSNCEQSGPGGQ